MSTASQEKSYRCCLIYSAWPCFAGLAGELTEQLRLILEPTRATRLAGEYRSGKRLNMRKVIAYIASHFRKDKIWLRRTRPDQRTYQVSTSAFHPSPGSHPCCEC